jgi:seryl-tRNA(Sec) selenium transferase
MARAICRALNNGRSHRERGRSRVKHMLIKRMIQTRKADAELATVIRAALIESRYAPIASLSVGAAALAAAAQLLA